MTVQDRNLTGNRDKNGNLQTLPKAADLTGLLEGVEVKEEEDDKCSLLSGTAYTFCREALDLYGFYDDGAIFDYKGMEFTVNPIDKKIGLVIDW